MVQINLLIVENCPVLLILITFEGLVFCRSVENITRYKMQGGYHGMILTTYRCTNYDVILLCSLSKGNILGCPLRVLLSDL